MRGIRVSIAVGALLLAAASSAQAALSRADQKKAKQILARALYLRFDAPCTQGRHPFGVFYSPLVEVSPTGSNSQATDEVTSAGTTPRRRWEATVNDSFRSTAYEYADEEPSVEIELEGAAPRRPPHHRQGHHSTPRRLPEGRRLAFAQTRPSRKSTPIGRPRSAEAIGKAALLNGMTSGRRITSSARR